MAKPLTDLDKQIIQMAVLNPSQFIALIGDDAWRAAKICHLRGKGFSYGEISQKLSVTFRQAEYGCGKCEGKE